MKLYRVALYRSNRKLVTAIIIAETKEDATDIFKKQYGVYLEDEYTNRRTVIIETEVITDDLTKAGMVWGY